MAGKEKTDQPKADEFVFMNSRQRANPGNAQLGEAVRQVPVLSGVDARVGQRRRKRVLTLVIPEGANLVAVTAAIEKALARR